ncbi:hypothetical protein [Peribacillus frigoritolerans]|uniref:hypothetical protein n=1 Tax=Peribacillus castrilensis TaxID=2897690 RepID=UPI00296EF3D3|nr:hypothetical protein [Peribacillus castrilensis]
MKKLLVVGLSALLLAACGTEEVTEKKVDKVESTEKAAPAEQEAAQKESDVIEVGKEVANTANMKATLVSVEKVVDKEWDEEYIDVKYEVENKLDKTIVIQAREVSADGKMVDDGLLDMSQEVAAGKKADAILRIQDYDGGELPAIEKNLEMLLLAIDNDTYEDIEQHKVNVDFK